MPEILPVQMAALLFGMISAGAADSAYHRGRITQRVHSLWLSLTIPAVCLPILSWAAAIFIGPGPVGRGLVVVAEAALFLWLYANLRKLPAARKLGHGLPPPPPKPSRPPANG
jgi:hypothetical protein